MLIFTDFTQTIFLQALRVKSFYPVNTIAKGWPQVPLIIMAERKQSVHDAALSFVCADIGHPVRSILFLDRHASRQPNTEVLNKTAPLL